MVTGWKNIPVAKIVASATENDVLRTGCQWMCASVIYHGAILCVRLRLVQSSSIRKCLLGQIRNGGPFKTNSITKVHGVF